MYVPSAKGIRNDLHALIQVSIHLLYCISKESLPAPEASYRLVFDPWSLISTRTRPRS